MHVCSTNKSESKSVIINACSLDESESKRVHITVNATKVKDATNKKRMKNLWLQMIKSSMRQAILNYSSAVKTSWKILKPHMNDHSW